MGEIFDHSAPAVADLFSAMVLVLVEILVIGMDPNHGTFDNRMIFFKSIKARE